MHDSEEILVVDIKESLLSCFFFFRRLSSFGHLSFEISAVAAAPYISFLASHAVHVIPFCRLAYAHLGAMHFTSCLYFQAPNSITHIF